MRYELRTTILPTHFQIGYFALNKGIEIGKIEQLHHYPISSLHYHHCIELGICMSGSGETHIENRVYRFRAGDIQYIPPDTPHISSADEGEKCEWLWIFADPKNLLTSTQGTILTEILESLHTGFSGVFSPHEHPRLAELILSLSERSEKDRFTLLDNLLTTGQILIEATRIGNIDKGQIKLPVSKQIKPALTYIRENYHDPQLITESLIAAHCGISVSRFRNLFKKDIGMTLPQYINHTRLSAAIHLLETTNKSIAEIATESGFFEVAYFNRVFRKYFGMSPKEMRKKRQHKY